MSDNNMIHDSVQDRYTKTIESMSSSCCGDDGCGSQLYNVSVIETIPDDISNLSLGCGDPVTIGSIQPGETVLDLGSGAGLDCFLAAKQTGDTGRVIGVDMTQAMLDKANANKDRLGVQNVEFRKGHIEALPVDDNQVDLIISNCVINLSPGKASVFKEAFRVLKPGGRIAVSDIVTEGEFSDELRADMDKWAECVTGAIPQEEYTGLMQDAGFVNIEVVDKSNAEGIVTRVDGMPHIYSARITAYKPR